VVQPIEPHRVQSGVAQHHLEHGSCGRVVVQNPGDVVAHALEYHAYTDVVGSS